MQKAALKSLQLSYKALLSDLKKADPSVVSAIKDAAEELTKVPSSNPPASSSLITVLTKSLELAFSSKSLRSYAHVLSIIQTLAGENLLLPDKKVKIVNHLSASINYMIDDKDIIKTLQILLTSLSTETITSPSFCPTVLSISLKAFSAKNALVRGTAISVLRRMYSVLFSTFSEGTFKICYDQLEELTGLVGDKYKAMNYKGIGIDLLNIVLVEYGEVLGKNKPIKDMLIRQLLPTLLFYIQSPATPFPLLVRAVRLSVKLMLVFSAFYELLVPMLSWVNSHLTWLRYLALEAVSILLDSSKQVKELQSITNNEAHNKVLKELINSLVRFTKGLIPGNPALEDKRKVSLIRRNKVFNDVTETVLIEPPKISRPQFLFLLGEALTGFIGSMEELFAEEEIRLGELPEGPFTESQTEHVVEPLKENWKLVYELFLYLLKESNEEYITQKILKGMQSLINMTGSIKFIPAMHGMLRSLCNLSLPLKLNPYMDYTSEGYAYQINYKHLLICNTIFNIAQCLHRVLDQRAWNLLFEALQKISCLIYKAEYEKSSITPNVFNFKVIGERILENVRKFTAAKSHGGSVESTPKKELLAGTGGEDGGGKGTSSEKVQLPTEEIKVSPKSIILAGGETEGRPKEVKVPKRAASVICRFGDIHQQSIDFYRKSIKIGPPSAQLNSLMQFGQDSAKDTPKKNTPINLEAEIDLLKTSLESLFTVTATFSDKGLYEFTMALGESALELLETLTDTPASVQNNNGVDRLNMFGVIRMLETAIVNIDRVHLLWDSVAAHLDCLANCKFPQLRALAVDALTCLITNVFLAKEKCEEDEKESIESYRVFWQKHSWQTKVLSPLLNCLKSGYPETIRTTIHNLPTIINNCGNSLIQAGWDIVYQIIEQTVAVSFSPPPGSDPYELIDLAFKFMETLVQRHLSSIDANGFTHLISAVYQFATYKGDVNTSVVALELLHTIAEQLSAERLLDCSEEKMFELWLAILVRLKELGCDERAEMRNRTFGTIEAIFNDNAEALSHNVWHHLFFDTLAQLIHFAELRFLACRTDDKGPNVAIATPTNVATPKFSMGAISSPKPPGRIMRFDEEAIRKERKDDAGKLREKQWEESIAILLSTFAQVLKQFDEYMEPSKEKAELRGKAWALLLDACSRLTKRGTYVIINSVLKLIQMLAYPFRDLMQNKLDDTWKIFEEFMLWINAEHHIGPYNQRPIGSKLSPVVVDALRAIFCQEGPEGQKVLMTSKTLREVCELLKKMLACSQTSEGFQGITTPHKLLSEERTIFAYIEEMVDITQTEEQYEIYLDFLLSFLNFRIEEPHIDAFIRRTLAVIGAHVTTCKLPPSLLKKTLPILYSKVTSLVNLRYNTSACKMLLFNSKTSNPLWCEAALHLMDISGFLIDPTTYQTQLEFSSPRSPRRYLEIDMPFDLAESGKRAHTDEGTGAEKPIEKVQTVTFKQKPKPSIRIPEDDDELRKEPIKPKPSINKTKEVSQKNLTADKELQELIWNLTLKSIKEMLCINEKALMTLDKYLAEDIMKKSQDLGISIVNFIFKSLLPSSENIGTEKQQELISIIDAGCTVLTTNVSISSSSVGGFNNDVLSQHCLNILIEMCETPVEEEEEFSEVKEKVAKMATPVLINRCKEVIKKFLADEKRNGLVPLPRQRVNDLLGLLDRLKETTIERVEPKGDVARAIFETGKGHLVYIMPELVECIGSKDGELRDKIKEVLLHISELLVTSSN